MSGRARPPVRRRRRAAERKRATRVSGPRPAAILLTRLAPTATTAANRDVCIAGAIACVVVTAAAAWSVTSPAEPWGR